jgi:hypothetical protein
MQAEFFGLLIERDCIENKIEREKREREGEQKEESES